MKLYPILSNLIVSVAAILMVVPAPLFGEQGIYNSASNTYWCSNEYSCIHEIAHKMDNEAGWISHSQEWNNALKVYILTETTNGKITDLAYYILTEKMQPHSLWYRVFRDENSELYANILAKCEGNITIVPTVLRPFYDWDAIMGEK